MHRKEGQEIPSALGNAGRSDSRSSAPGARRGRSRDPESLPEYAAARMSEPWSSTRRSIASAGARCRSRGFKLADRRLHETDPPRVRGRLARPAVRTGSQDRDGQSALKRFRTGSPPAELHDAAPRSAPGPRKEMSHVVSEAITARDRVPQTAPTRCRARSRTTAGGYAWAVDDWTRLRRFLDPRLRGRLAITRREGKLTRKNARGGRACLLADGQRTVAEIVAGRRRRAGRRRTTRRCSRSRWRRAR